MPRWVTVGEKQGHMWLFFFSLFTFLCCLRQQPTQRCFIVTHHCFNSSICYQLIIIHFALGPRENEIRLWRRERALGNAAVRWFERNRMNEISGVCTYWLFEKDQTLHPDKKADLQECFWLLCVSVYQAGSGIGLKIICTVKTHTVSLPPTNKENRTPKALGAYRRAIKTNTLCAKCLWVICQTEKPGGKEREQSEMTAKKSTTRSEWAGYLRAGLI